MTEKMVEYWNERVAKGDVVYHLGDFFISWGKKSSKEIDGLLSRLNGNKFLIYGNHDRDEVKNSPLWTKVLGYHEVKVSGGDIQNQRITLSHYSMRTWNQMHRGSWMLHGHSHGSLLDIGGKTIDVGVDCHEYKPISFEQVGRIMLNRETTVVDHHE